VCAYLRIGAAVVSARKCIDDLRCTPAQTTPIMDSFSEAADPVVIEALESLTEQTEGRIKQQQAQISTLIQTIRWYEGALHTKDAEIRTLSGQLAKAGTDEAALRSHVQRLTEAETGLNQRYSDLENAWRAMGVASRAQADRMLAAQSLFATSTSGDVDAAIQRALQAGMPQAQLRPS